MKKLFALLLACVLLCSLVPASHVMADDHITDMEEIPSDETAEEIGFAEDRVLVVFSNEASLEFKSYSVADFQEIGCKSVSVLTESIGEKMEARMESVKLAATDSVQLATDIDSELGNYNQVVCLELNEKGEDQVLAAIKKLQERDDVIYAGPDYVLTANAITPNDTYYGSQWAMGKIQVLQAWDISTGSSTVKVGVIDTGIYEDHEDLSIQHDLCAEFRTTEIIQGDHCIDPDGHGTKVAGVIGAKRNNSKGISGVAPDITLVSLRVCDEDNAMYSSYVANAINYAESNDIQILNISLGWSMQKSDEKALYDEPLMSVIQNYSGLVVCSAGNDKLDLDSKNSYPASYNLPNLITVGASTKTDGESSDSNYGKTTVDLFAPGLDIYTTTNRTKGYANFSGTSAAAPLVTGVSALIQSANPNLLPCEIKDTIIKNVDDCGTAFDSLCVSKGRLNAYKAITNVREHTHVSTNISISGGHTKKCMTCNFSRVEAHNFKFQQYDAQDHAVICTVCHYVYLQKHVQSKPTVPCLVCGYKA